MFSHTATPFLVVGRGGECAEDAINGGEALMGERDSYLIPSCAHPVRPQHQHEHHESRQDEHLLAEQGIDDTTPWRRPPPAVK